MSHILAQYNLIIASQTPPNYGHQQKHNLKHYACSLVSYHENSMLSSSSVQGIEATCLDQPTENQVQLVSCARGEPEQLIIST
jgi:hypothetical protein